MGIKNYFCAAGALLLLMTLGVGVASAQTVELSGKVTLRQADGTVVPVKDATVDIYRTDIRGDYHTKTDKSGHYVNVGLPFSGTFTIIVSAPNAKPSFVANAKPSQQPVYDFTLEPGDGHRLTLDEVNANGAASGGKDSAEARRAREELAKKNAEIEAENKKITENNAKLQSIFKAANDALTAKNYDEAIAGYDQGIQIDPEIAGFYINKSVALLHRGVEKFNTAVKAKDNAGKESAKADFKAAVEASEKGVSLARENMKKNASGAGTTGGSQSGTEPLNNDLAIRAENYRVALHTSTPVSTDDAIKAIQEYLAAETDPAKKTKMQLSLGEALVQSGQVDQAVATYKQILASKPNDLDAIYDLGIAYAADPSGSKLAEARDTLYQFAKNAPASDPRKQDALNTAKALDDTLKQQKKH